MTTVDVLNKIITQNDIGHFSKQITDCDSRINAIKKTKEILRRKISKKQKYIEQLERGIEQESMQKEQ